MIKKILMATDGSKTSIRALKVAIEMAKKMGAKLALVGVIDNRLYVGRTMPASSSPTRIAESVEDYLMQVAGAYLADASRLCMQGGIEPEIVIRSGHPAEEILKEARRWKADLLVLGSHTGGDACATPSRNLRGATVAQRQSRHGCVGLRPLQQAGVWAMALCVAE